MQEKQTSPPVTPKQVEFYLHNLQRTDDYLYAMQAERTRLHERARTASPEQKKEMGRLMLQRVVGQTAEEVTVNRSLHEGFRFNEAYNELLRALPGFDTGQTNLDRHRGDKHANIELVIPLNHALKELIDQNPAMSPQELETMIEFTLRSLHYPLSHMETITRDIIPGMEQELACEQNLHYLPGNPLILEAGVSEEEFIQGHTPATARERAITRKEAIAAERKGIDYKIIWPDGITIATDVKKSEAAAWQAREEHDQWRRANHVTGVDNHLIIWTGYDRRKGDFVPDRIGRVTEAARLREQDRINAEYVTKYRQLRHERQLLTNR
jgi:hypothetical protein